MAKAYCSKHDLYFVEAWLGEEVCEECYYEYSLSRDRQYEEQYDCRDETFYDDNEAHQEKLTYEKASLSKW